MKKTIRLTESELINLVKQVMTESKMDNPMNKYLLKHNIEIKYAVPTVFQDKVAGKFFLYKGGKRYGLQSGYNFGYRMVGGDKFELEFIKTMGDIRTGENINHLDEFKHFPEDILINYFSQKVKDFILEKFRSEGQ